MNPSSLPAFLGPQTTSRHPRSPQPRTTARRAQVPGGTVRQPRAVLRVAARQAAPQSPPPASLSSPTPAPGTAQIKLELQPRTDNELVTFAESHVTAMEDNPWFPNPVPSMDDFDARLAAFEAKLTEMAVLQARLLNVTQQKDQLRRELEAAFNQRASYIQMASRGNPDAIASTALAIRRPRTRTGTLPPPQSLVASVTQVPGQVLLTWDTVPGARSFLLECALFTDGEPLLWTTLYVGGQLRYLAPDLTPGQRYAFRLATIGGKDGRSAWSPVVERMVA